MSRRSKPKKPDALDEAKRFLENELKEIREAKRHAKLLSVKLGNKKLTIGNFYEVLGDLGE